MRSIRAGVVAVAMVVLPGSVLAQAAPVTWATSLFGGALQEEGVSSLAIGYGVSFRRMKEASSLDFAFDLANYQFPTETIEYDAVYTDEFEYGIIGLTGSAIYQRPGSSWQLIGGVGGYRLTGKYSELEYGEAFNEETFTQDAIGYHVGLGRRISSNFAVESRYVRARFADLPDETNSEFGFLTAFLRFTF